MYSLKKNSNNLDKSFPVLVMGELELSGKVRNVRGVHAAVSTAFSSGITNCIVPSGNAEEAREVKGMKVFGATSLENAFFALNNPSSFSETGEKKSDDEWFKMNGSVEFEGVWFPKTGRILRIFRNYRAEKSCACFGNCCVRRS